MTFRLPKPLSPGVSRIALAVLLCAAGPLPAQAHDTWLAALERNAKSSSTLDLSITSGERFPQPGSAIAPERIETASCRQGSRAIELKPGRRQAKALQLTTGAVDDAATTCWVQLAPRSLTLAPSTVEHYLEEIDAPASVRQAWTAAPAPKRWKETYTKNAKIVMPGTGASGESPQPPVGLKLELVLEGGDRPQARAAGLPVLALLDGKPRAGLSIALTSERAGPPQRLRTDAQGRVVFPSRPTGRWMLSATDLVPLDAAAGEWTSQFSTLVFERPRAQLR